MAARIFFKRVLPGAVVYYGGVQGYLAYYLLCGPEGKVRKPELPEIEADGSRKKLVENMLSIYQLKTKTDNFETFADDVEVEDHSGLVKGKKSLMNALFMAKALGAKAETLKVDTHHYQDQFIMELLQHYSFCGCEMEIPSVVYAKTEGEGDNEKVKVWRDEWFGKELLTSKNTRFLFAGAAARLFRRMHGKLCNLKKYDEPKEVQMEL